MKISKSKQELARIINENGRWCDGAEFAWFQGKLKGGPCHEVWFGEEDSEPEYVPASGSFHSYWSMVVGKFPATKFDNWHQTILSREEYFHLYPAPDADGWIEWKSRFYGDMPVPEGTEVDIMVDGTVYHRYVAEVWKHWGTTTKYRLYKSPVAQPEPEVPAKPTIEQLAADYRNAKDYARRKQQEADAANAAAEAKLAELVDAGKELGLVPVSVVKPAIDGCMQLVDMVPTRLQSHQEESVAAIGHVVNVERLYDKVRDAYDSIK